MQELQANNRFTSKSSELVKGCLREVGIDVRPQILDKATADDHAGKGNYTVALIGYGGMTGDPDQNLRIALAASPKSPSFTRAIGRAIPEVPDLANRQLATLDPAQRKTLIPSRSGASSPRTCRSSRCTRPPDDLVQGRDLRQLVLHAGLTPSRGTSNKHVLATGKKAGF